MPTKDIGLVDLVSTFDSEQDCLDYLEKLRWPDGVQCPRCESTSVSHVEKRNIWDCNSCRYQFSVKSGTVFHDSHLPLQKWFLAVFLMVESRKGMSGNQLRRMLKIAPKTAFHLTHRIRYAMGVAEDGRLTGTVEVDEAFIGGESQGMGRGAYLKNKAIAIGAIQRGGELRLKHIPDAKKKTLHAFIHNNVDDDADFIYTDEWKSYPGIGTEERPHKTVNHHKGEWVNGNVHTNTIENVWSLLKRSVIGSYHKVSKKHFDSYLGELEHRFNNRENPYIFRDTMRKLVTTDKLEYKKLTA